MNKYQIGEEVINNKNLKMTLMKYNSANDVEVLFEKSGETVKTRYHRFKNGTTQDNTAKSRIGKTNINNQGLKMTIIEYYKSNNIIVLFESGETVKAEYSKFKKGGVADPSLTKGRLGQEKDSTNCGSMTIINYADSMNIEVLFVNTGTTVKTRYDTFQDGHIIDPFFPSICGIGFIGTGKYNSMKNGKKSNAYNTWQHMLRRCYCAYSLNEYPTYIEATVCKEWHNFNTFAEWYHENYYEIPGEIMHLDKDLTERGNKQYSPDMSSFVPQPINALLTKCDLSRGKYLIGVTYYEDRQDYRANVAIDGKAKHLGFFPTELLAFYAYKEAKEENIKVMANRYKEYLPTKVYNYLINYRVLQSD